jgi:two-component system, response regulator
MPGKDGRLVLKELKASPQLRPIPVIVLTTSQEKVGMDYSLKMGANSVASKPARFREWVGMMKSFSTEWLKSQVRRT